MKDRLTEKKLEQSTKANLAAKDENSLSLVGKMKNIVV